MGAASSSQAGGEQDEQAGASAAAGAPAPAGARPLAGSAASRLFGSLSSSRPRSWHAAAKAGQTAALEVLLQPLVQAVTLEMSLPGRYPGPAAAALGAAVSAADRSGRTPLHVACLHGNVECVLLLLEAGSNILAADSDGNGCLHLAAIKGHGHVVQQLLERAEAQGIAARLVNTLNLSGFSPLHYAAWAAHVHILRQLLLVVSSQHTERALLQGCWDTYDRWLLVPLGATPLHVAAQQQHTGAVLALLMLHALRLRDSIALPGEPRPVDPRSRPDRQGAVPLHLALWRGLNPDSQLAALLNPRVDVANLFTAEQLEQMRRHGPPLLQVLAANALKAHLLEQLGDLQLLQRHLAAEAAEAAARSAAQAAQQRQPKRSAESHEWRRWWGGQGQRQAPAALQHAAGTAPLGAPPACGDGRPAVPHQSQQQAQEVQAQQQHEELLAALHRTPSITLGAVQKYSAAAVQPRDQQQQRQQQQHGALEPGSEQVAQQHALPSDNTAGSSLASASSITIGCLDRVWALAPDGQPCQPQPQQAQQQQQQASAAPAACSEASQPVTPEPSINSQQRPHMHSPTHSSLGGSCCEIQIEHGGEADLRPPAGQQLPQPGGPPPQQQQQQQQRQQQQGQHAPYAAINEVLHKATGTTGFRLVPLAVPAEPASSHSPVRQPAPRPLRCNQAKPPSGAPLASSSVTLAQLAAAKQRLPAAAGAGSGRRSPAASPDGCGPSSSSGSSVQGSASSCSSRARQHAALLATAGIKGAFTPLSWKLHQQQQQQQEWHSPPQQPAAAALSSSVPATPPAPPLLPLGGVAAPSRGGSCSSSSASGAPTAWPQVWPPSAPCHRRSFELPGSSPAGVGGVLRSHRAAVSRMLLEAGRVDARSLALERKSLGCGRAGAGGSSALAVATSLAGALPGCVSAKLTEVLQVASPTAAAAPASTAGSFSLAGLGGAGPSPAASAATAPGGWRGSLERAPSVSSCSSSRRGTLLAAPSVAAASDAAGLATCAVCMDEAAAVGMASCTHALCFQCATCIVGAGVNVRPPVCPFCRAHISKFELVGLGGAARP